jgi:hypothetical protein
MPHGALPTELRLLHQAGMPVRDLIAAATSVVACEVGLPGRVGTPGAQADLLVVDGNPLRDRETLERVALVIVEACRSTRRRRIRSCSVECRDESNGRDGNESPPGLPIATGALQPG